MANPGNSIGRTKWELDTPCLVIDEEILDRNIRTMQSFVVSRGKQLRPHAKTHKCSRIAQKQLAAGALGLCVAKVSEAEGLIEKGLGRILITSPVVTERKIERLIACLSRDPGLMVVVDNPENARRLHDAVKRAGLTLQVLVDLDPGNGRTGARFEDGVGLGDGVQSLASLRLRGIQCYAGQVQHISSFEDRQKASVGWLHQAADVFRQLRDRGLPAEIFSGSGTGTHEIDCEVAELTELQAGSYTVMDAEYLSIGSSRNPSRFENFPPALTLLTTVISSNHAGFFTVDAGLKALYHHGAAPSILRPDGLGLTYDWWGDEHGRINVPEQTRTLQIGEVLELVVSHCDPTVNLFDAFCVTRGGVVTDVWPIDLRGKSQ